MSTVIKLPIGRGTPPPLEEAGQVLPPCLSRHLEYLRSRELSDTTIYKRRRALIRLREEIGHSLFEVTPAELAAWRAALLDRIAAESAAAEIWHVKDFYAWAVATRKMRTDPARGLRYPRLGRRIPRPISDDKLMRALIAAPYPIRPMLVLAGWAGLRCKEIALLRRVNVLESARPPVLLIAGDATKGRNERVVPMSDFVLAELVPHLPASGWVFRRADGQPGPNRPWRISHIVNTFLHEAGIEETAHQLRHRFGTAAYQASRDIRVVQELMGHVSPTTTAGYAAYSNADALAAVQALPMPRRFRSAEAGHVHPTTTASYMAIHNAEASGSAQ
jgi:integrase/recombinase XerC